MFGHISFSKSKRNDSRKSCALRASFFPTPCGIEEGRNISFFSELLEYEPRGLLRTCVFVFAFISKHVFASEMNWERTERAALQSWENKWRNVYTTHFEISKVPYPGPRFCRKTREKGSIKSVCNKPNRLTPVLVRVGVPIVGRHHGQDALNVVDGSVRDLEFLKQKAH